MNAPQPNIPFAMPMFRAFVPRRLQPWIYVCIAVTFQLSGGLYLGTLSQMMGETALMREDLLMCLYANLAGMAIYFPLLFRMKFRFTNKTLLCAAATGVLACNLLAPHVHSLPLLWTVCFVSGICKIQGTFECMSNIQLWMTPKRDFTVFFPVLHVIILGCMQVSDWLSIQLMYHYHWTYMHIFIAGLMMLDLLVLTLCTRHFRIVKKFPLYGIDWLGALLWALLLLEVAFLFNYGEYYDWWNSPALRRLGVAILFTLGLCLWRMYTIRHPFFEPRMWTYRRLVPILLLITCVEAFLATEHVLEEVFYEEVMHYGTTTVARLDGWSLLGVWAGCLFAYWWMHVRRLPYLRLITAGILMLGVYLASMYFTLSPDMPFSRFALPVACRGFAYAVLSITFMTCLEEIMTFQHFFQALSVFNMLHMVVGGVMGAALYSHGLSYYVADNLSRYGVHLDSVAFPRAPFDLGAYMESFISRIMAISVKQIYGWVLYACLLLLLLFLLYDAPIRRSLKQMPRWQALRREIARAVRLPRRVP